ncbi:MAG: VWA domain-containing protein [Candidatus Omnitrophica bacterium]|nr:VWA domain-containing protein [Candidatus Omnitrophota bacterium]
MVFRSPWILLLIPVFLWGMWYLSRRRYDGAFQFSSIALLLEAGQTWRTQLSFIPRLLRQVVVVLFLVALSGPQTVLEESRVTTEGIEIILAVDCSGSMAAEDFTINGQRMNRLEVIKNVVSEFIAGRKHDKIGFVAFSAKAYTICPLTTDYQWLTTNLGRVQLGMIEDGTAIGSAIATAVGRLKESTAKSKVLIVLTDGINNAGSVEPLTAARAAQAAGIKVYTIGAGTKGYAPFPVQDFFGRVIYQNVKIDIDEDTLQKVSKITNGLYYRATDTDSLKKIYKEIDGLEKTKIEEVGYREYKELFVYFLSAALMLLLLEVLLANSVFLKIP